jgi:hypothetical protein
MTDIQIGFISSWGDEPQNLLNQYSQLTPNNSGAWKNIIGTQDIQLSEYIICLDRPSISHAHAIHFRREPNIIKPWHAPASFLSNFDYSSVEKYHVCTRAPNSYNLLETESYIKKTKHISAVSSDKHLHRTSFIKSIIANFSDRIDYFGNIFTGKCVTSEQRRKAFSQYSMSVCIENCAQENYFTEKITDSILSWCMPLYWGCPNIDQFLPEGSYRLINLDQPDQIMEIANKPISNQEIKAMQEARNLILNKYNIWATIHNILS